METVLYAILGIIYLMVAALSILGFIADREIPARMLYTILIVIGMGGAYLVFGVAL
ncbi:hypothetical protein H7S74_30300 [Priestia aryabhattai]|uniref:hypothetical protein n=1 Tax=Priestia aryabhattai TaxID=412384 RepID=UPI001EC4C804|nr:hypothetical protein [Priestia aryabhattai]MBY0094925.1 hypothetical protein [Priestia aryabhattai]MBY0105587.1 hypothetical protein [Priestia aryabhattai]